MATSGIWPTTTASGLSPLTSSGFMSNHMFYRAGSEYQTAAGQVYANATRVLMQSGPKAGKMFWSL